MNSNVRTSLSTDVVLKDAYENSVRTFVLNPGCCPRFRRSHVLLNHRSTAPVNRHFVKSTAPRGQRAVKSALNPGYSCVKPRLCPGVGGPGFQLTDALHLLFRAVGLLPFKYYWSVG